MDPDQTLRDMRHVVAKVLRDYGDPDGNGVDQDDARDLAEHFNALDEWMSRGGFLPNPWTKRGTP